MSEVTIYHNPRCSKSRQTLALLEERGIDPNEVLYLEQPPSAAELRDILDALNLEPRALMRKGESAYKEQALASVEDADALIAAMVSTPILIQRPIVVNGPKAALGRPPENVLEIL